MMHIHVEWQNKGTVALEFLLKYTEGQDYTFLSLNIQILAFISKNSTMTMLKMMQFDVRCVRSARKMAPGAIQFHGLWRCHGGLYRSYTH